MNWGNSITYLATARVKGQPVRFGIKDADRTLHLTIVGKTGSGKPGFVATMALQDIARGMGVLVLDSVGNVTQTLLERLPAEARERLIVLDPSDGEHPYSWNALDDFRTLPPEEALARLAETLASVYQCENNELVAFAASYMLAHKDATILVLYNLVADVKARDKMLVPKTPERENFDTLLSGAGTAIEAITENGKYLAKDTLPRNILGQRDSKFTLEVLQKGGVVVVDLSRTRMFPTRITPFVRLFVAAGRVRGTAEAPIAIYMHDCLRYFSAQDFEKAILDRTVAFAFSDTSHGEEEKTLREKALQRSGSVIAFSPHEMDFKIVERTFYPYVAAEDLEKLSDGDCVVALAIDAVRSRPFFASPLELPARSGISPRDLELESRTKYTCSRLSADELFRPKKEEESKGDKAEDPGSFSDAFRSIFTKRAGGGTDADKAPPTAAGAAPAAKPPQKEEKKSLNATPQKNETPQKTSEIPEEELKKMLHVRKVSKNK